MDIYSYRSILLRSKNYSDSTFKVGEELGFHIGKQRTFLLLSLSDPPGKNSSEPILFGKAHIHVGLGIGCERISAKISSKVFERKFSFVGFEAPPPSFLCSFSICLLLFSSSSTQSQKLPF